MPRSGWPPEGKSFWPCAITEMLAESMGGFACSLPSWKIRLAGWLAFLYWSVHCIFAMVYTYMRAFVRMCVCAWMRGRTGVLRKGVLGRRAGGRVGWIFVFRAEFLSVVSVLFASVR